MARRAGGEVLDALGRDPRAVARLFVHNLRLYLKYTLLPPAAVRDKRTTLIKEVPLILEATREFIGGFVQNARRSLNAIKAIGRRRSEEGRVGEGWVRTFGSRRSREP